MGDVKDFPGQDYQRFTVIRDGDRPVSPVLVNLMRDTGAPILIFLAERYGLRRVPGLSHDNLIQRILSSLTPEQLAALEQELIAARFGTMTVRQLLDLALEHDAQRLGPTGKPRLDQVSPSEAVLVEGSPRCWVYTLRGHYAVIDLVNRRLSCDCHHFSFASRHMALCKHLVTVLELIPAAYAREVLIDLLVSRDYGGQHTDWQFDHSQAA